MAILTLEDTLNMHKEAMYFAQDGFVAQTQGNEAEAIFNFARALEIERAVLSRLESFETNIETLGIIIRSAASIAYNCKEYDQVEEIIESYEAIELPEQIRDEIDLIREEAAVIRDERSGVSVGDETLVIDPVPQTRAFLALILKKISRLFLFDNLEAIDGYLESNPLPAVLVLGLSESDDCTRLLDMLIRLSEKYHLVGKAKVIVLAQSKEDYASFPSVYERYFSFQLVKPFNPVDLINGVRPEKKSKQGLLKRLGGRFRVLDYSNVKYPDGRISAGKRLVDLLISSVGLLILIPAMFIIGIILKLESKGPIFYKSYRAGWGYRIFRFIKFRTMFTGEKGDLVKIRHAEQETSKEGGPLFFKVNNDPRITRFGAFLRNTSLDELPQLFNVFLGDMSLVGNRPLPLYEAQTLTGDRYNARFLCAVGITGLWQIKKRGNMDMSVEERISMDIEYSQTHSFKTDLWILVNTPSALLKKDNV